MCIYIYIDTYTCTYISLYIYIYREREIYMCVFKHIHNTYRCVYIYIYIYVYVYTHTYEYYRLPPFLAHPAAALSAAERARLEFDGRLRGKVHTQALCMFCFVFILEEKTAITITKPAR